jgi:hypothetical protein
VPPLGSPRAPTAPYFSAATVRGLHELECVGRASTARAVRSVTTGCPSAGVPLEGAGPSEGLGMEEQSFGHPRAAQNLPPGYGTGAPPYLNTGTWPCLTPPAAETVRTIRPSSSTSRRRATGFPGPPGFWPGTPRRSRRRRCDSRRSGLTPSRSRAVAASMASDTLPGTVTLGTRGPLVPPELGVEAQRAARLRAGARRELSARDTRRRPVP